MHKILRTLILSDLFLLGSFGLISPIFAVFMLQKIPAITITAIGVATAIQLITKSFFQILVGRWTDAEAGNKRELFTLFIGSIVMSMVPFGYIFSASLAHIYTLQFIYGLGSALIYPGWIVIFTRYTRDEKAGYEWSVYNTIISLGTAAAAFLGGYFAETFSFTPVFVAVGVLSFIGTGFIVTIFKHEFTHFHLNKKEVKTLWQKDTK